VEAEGTAEAAEGEATAVVVEAAVAAEDMIAVTTATADRTETADRHQWKKVKKLTSQ